MSKTQKVKNDPKIKSKNKVVIEENLRNKRCLSTWVQPKTVFNPTLTPKLALKLSLIEENLKNKKCLSTWVQSNTVLNPMLNLENSLRFDKKYFGKSHFRS